MTQLTLFDLDMGGDEKTQPLPLQVAAKYDFPLQYHTSDADVILYAVQDWIAGVAKTGSPRDFWSKVKKRFQKSGIELYPSCLQLPYRATNGKTYKMDFANDVTLYRITQRMDAETGIRNEVLDYLAKAGAFMDELRQDPESIEVKAATIRQVKAARAGKDDAWQAAREMGIVTRKQFTAAVMGANVNADMGRATNGIYQGVLGMNADGLRAHLGIGAKQNPRDHMGRVALGYTMIAEEVVAIHLGGYADHDVIPVSVIYNTINTLSRAVGVQAQDMARMVGIDLATGRPLLSQGMHQ